MGVLKIAAERKVEVGTRGKQLNPRMQKLQLRAPTAKRVPLSKQSSISSNLSKISQMRTRGQRKQRDCSKRRLQNRRRKRFRLGMEWKYDLTEVMEFMIPGLALCIETGGYLRKS